MLWADVISYCFISGEFQLMSCVWPQESRTQIGTLYSTFTFHIKVWLKMNWEHFDPLCFCLKHISLVQELPWDSIPSLTKCINDKSCILTTHFYSGALLSNKNLVVNIKITQHAKVSLSHSLTLSCSLARSRSPLYVVIRALLSCHALLVFLKWWPLAH